MKKYLSGHFWEFIACLVMSAVMVVFFSQGFYVPDRIADSIPLALLISAGVTLGCYVLGYNRKTMKLTFIILVVLIVVFLLLLRAGNVDIVDMEGSETSIFIYVFAAVLLPIAVYLLSRTKVGMIIAVGLGAALCGTIDYLAYETKVWWIVLFILAALVLLALRIYRFHARQSSTYHPKFKNLFLSALIVAALGTGVAGGVYGAIIRPLDPPTIDIELVIKVLTYDMLDRIGIAQYYTIPDELLQAYQQMQQIESSNKVEIEKQAEEDDAEDPEDEEEQGEKTGFAGAVSSFFEAITYWLNPVTIAISIIILVAIVVFLIVFLKRIIWKIRLQQLMKLSPRDRTIRLCRYYMERFRRMGFPRMRHYTEQEYAHALSDTLDPYLEGSGLTLDSMMQIYCASRYGAFDPSKDEESRLIGLNTVYKKNFRKIRGVFMFIVKYFRL